MKGNDQRDDHRDGHGHARDVDGHLQPDIRERQLRPITDRSG